MVGVALPFALGYGFWAGAPHPMMGDGGDLNTVAIFIGATLTATSVGITARVLGDLGRMETPEARIILGAAVLDDVIGLVILSVVSGLAAGGAISVARHLRPPSRLPSDSWCAAVLAGKMLMPRLADGCHPNAGPGSGGGALAGIRAGACSLRREGRLGADHRCLCRLA